MNTTDATATDYYAEADAYRATATTLRERASELRNRFAERVFGGSAVSLATALNNIAEAEGTARAYETAADAAGNALAGGRVVAEQVRRALELLVLAGPDDQASGRTNDVRRASFDGLARGAREIFAGLDAGSAR